MSNITTQEAGDGLAEDRNRPEGWNEDSRLVRGMECTADGAVLRRSGVVSELRSGSVQEPADPLDSASSTTGFTLSQLKAAYIAGYAQGNCLSGTLDGEDEWEDYHSCVVMPQDPVSVSSAGDSVNWNG